MKKRLASDPDAAQPSVADFLREFNEKKAAEASSTAMEGNADAVDESKDG